MALATNSLALRTPTTVNITSSPSPLEEEVLLFTVTSTLWSRFSVAVNDAAE
jgi:hypothetical protein